MDKRGNTEGRSRIARAAPPSHCSGSTSLRPGTRPDVGGDGHDGSVPSRIADVLDLVQQLPDVVQHDHDRYLRFRVSGHTFGYLWERIRTVGLKQTLAEQHALVHERPDVFEVQFTAGGFGWVVAQLDLLERDELAELLFEAWRLTAPAAVVDQRHDVLPR